MKKNNWFILLLFTVIPLLAFDCGSNEGHNCITFVNKSDKDIYIIQRTIPMENQDDTLFTCGSINTVLTPNNKFCFDYGVIDKWSDYFKARSSVQYTILSKPFYYSDSCSNEQIRDFTERYQLRRYQLTKEDLDNMNWTVTYP